MIDNGLATFILAAEGEQPSGFNLNEFVSVFGVLCGQDDKRRGLQDLWKPVPVGRPQIQMIYAELPYLITDYQEKWDAMFYLTESVMHSFTRERGVEWLLNAYTSDPLHMQINRAVRVSSNGNAEAWNISDVVHEFFTPVVKITKTFED